MVLQLSPGRELGRGAIANFLNSPLSRGIGGVRVAVNFSHFSINNDGCEVKLTAIIWRGQSRQFAIACPPSRSEELLNKIFAIARLTTTANDENGNKNYPTGTDSQSAVTKKNL
jgi:hypothetical protein